MAAKKNRATKNKKKALNDVYEVEKILQKRCEKKGQVIGEHWIFRYRDWVAELLIKFILDQIFD